MYNIYIYITKMKKSIIKIWVTEVNGWERYNDPLPVEYSYRSQDLPSANGRLQTMPTTITALFSFSLVQAGFTGRPDVPQ